MWATTALRKVPKPPADQLGPSKPNSLLPGEIGRLAPRRSVRGWRAVGEAKAKVRAVGRVRAMVWGE
jgi:hypothetical protein